MSWSDADINKAKKILARHSLQDFSKALAQISKALGRSVSSGALRAAFHRKGLPAPTTWSASPKPATDGVDGPPITEQLQKLFKLTKRSPMEFSDLCDKLDVSPKKLKALLEEAKSIGHLVHVENNRIGYREKDVGDNIQKTGIAPVVGQWQKVAVISDTHLGSKYCLREQLIDFIHHAYYEEGVREILHPGDVLDGNYRHGVWEVSHSGLDAQAQDLFDTLPQLPGLTYHAITGNHDETFWDGAGLDVGKYLEGFFATRGRTDLKFYGNRGAFIKIRGVVVHLWHPKKGTGYARSYGIQKQIEKYTVTKPHAVLAGHWHVFCQVFERGVYGIACPTFQGGGSSFGKSLGGSPAIGGLILKWRITKDGTMRDFSLQKRTYFEVEKPVKLNTTMDGEMVSSVPTDDDRRSV